jgi:hypothetical protein
LLQLKKDKARCCLSALFRFGRRRHVTYQQITLTPFERNIEVWRQLWRVVERCDVVVQIVDARDPLLYRCEDLEKYVKETGAHKANVLVLNKADLLSPAFRSPPPPPHRRVQLRFARLRVCVVFIL